MKRLSPNTWMGIGVLIAIALIIIIGTLTTPLTPEQAALLNQTKANTPALEGGPVNITTAYASSTPYYCTSTFTRQDAVFTVGTYVQSRQAAMNTNAQSPTLGNATVLYVFTPDRAYIKVTPDVQAQAPNASCAWLRLPPTSEPLPGVVELLAGGANATCVPTAERVDAFTISGTVCDYNPAKPTA